MFFAVVVNLHTDIFRIVKQKGDNTHGPNGYSPAPNTTRTIICKAWNALSVVALYLTNISRKKTWSQVVMLLWTI